jgi:hypothetical protein
MACYVSELMLNWLEGIDDSLYKFSLFVSVTGQYMAANASKLITRKAVSTSITYYTCILFTFNGYRVFPGGKAAEHPRSPSAEVENE